MLSRDYGTLPKVQYKLCAVKRNDGHFKTLTLVSIIGETLYYYNISAGY